MVYRLLTATGDVNEKPDFRPPTKSTPYNPSLKIIVTITSATSIPIPYFGASS